MEYKVIYLSIVICISLKIGAVIGKDFACKPEQGSKLSELLGDQEKFPMSCQTEHDIDKIVRQHTQQGNTLKMLALVIDAMSTEIIEQRKKTVRMENELAEMRNRRETNAQLEFCNEHDGILYNGTCLWEEERSENMTLENAYRKCNSVRPSKLPEFYNEEQYNQIMDFLRTKIPSGETSIMTRTGMTRNHWTGEAFLSNGDLAPYVQLMQLREQWIDGSMYRTNVYLYALRSIFSRDNGMGAISPSYIFEDRVATILCQSLPFFPESSFKTEEDRAWCNNIGGIAYNGSCLWAEDAPDDMTKPRALEVCNERAPSKLPEVYGGQEYIEFMEYIRKKIKTKVILAWTGMSRNVTTNQAMLSDGEPAPYTKPRTNDIYWEDALDSETNVYLIARTDTTSNDQGVGTVWNSYGLDYGVVFCQKL